MTTIVEDKIKEALGKSSALRSDDKLVRINNLISKIQDLEARGLLKRQQFSCPTTSDFEREVLHKKST